MPTKKSKTELAEEKANSYHSSDMVASKRIVQAINNAEKGIAEDIKGLLKSFQYKGGFKTEKEAQAYLDEPISEASRKYMLGRIKAGKLSKSAVQKYLTRLGAPSTKAYMTRKQSIATILGINAPTIAEAIKGNADPFLKKTVTEAYGRQSFEIQKNMNVAFNTDMPTLGAVRQIATKALPTSTTTSMATQVMSEIRAQIIEQMLQGKSYYDIAKKVAGGTGTEVWRAKRLVRTIMTEASAEAELVALEDAGFSEYEYIATKDERTCPVCGRLDGRTFKLNKKQVGINFPPMHPNCRCTIGTVMDEDEKKQYKKSAKDKQGKNIQIPADWTYEDWAKEYYPKGYKASQTVVIEMPKSSVVPTPPPGKGHHYDKYAKFRKTETTTVKAPEPTVVKPTVSIKPPDYTKIRAELNDGLKELKAKREAEDYGEDYSREDYDRAIKAYKNKITVMKYKEDPERFIEEYDYKWSMMSSEEQSKMIEKSKRIWTSPDKSMGGEASVTSVEGNYEPWEEESKHFETLLSEEEKRAINGFTRTGYIGDVNLLRGNSSFVKPELIDDVNHITSALEKSNMPAFASYRGIDNDIFMFGKRASELKEGDSFMVTEFMSSSTSIRTASDFADMDKGSIIQFEFPATKGVAAPIKTILEHKPENEILINRDCVFEFVGTKEVETFGEKMTVYRMRMIG